MKEYKTLTRWGVNVEPLAARYFSKEPPLMDELGDRTIDLVLNGATLNAISKTEVRGLLRETYAALKRYEEIGPMASPFANDPAAIVARAFKAMYPYREFYAQIVPEIRDENDEPAYGATAFPASGGVPQIYISAEAPISALPELLAHELAHIAAGKDAEAEHGTEWAEIFEAISDKYREIIAIEAPKYTNAINVRAPKPGDISIITMPLRENVSDPDDPKWLYTTCPICGRDCVVQADLVEKALEIMGDDLGMACTLCALTIGHHIEEAQP